MLFLYIKRALGASGNFMKSVTYVEQYENLKKYVLNGNNIENQLKIEEKIINFVMKKKKKTMQ